MPTPTRPAGAGRLAARNAIRANPQIRLTTVPRRVEDPEALRELVLCDWIFLAADSHSARHWVNAVVHEFLIPATQVGVKIPVSADGDVGQIHTATRLIAPGIGCMWCNGLIDPTELAIEMHPETEREQARYNGGGRWCTPTGNLGRGASGELSAWQAVSSRS